MEAIVSPRLSLQSLPAVSLWQKHCDLIGTGKYVDRPWMTLDGAHSASHSLGHPNDWLHLFSCCWHIDIRCLVPICKFLRQSVFSQVSSVHCFLAYVIPQEHYPLETSYNFGSMFWLECNWRPNQWYILELWIIGSYFIFWISINIFSRWSQ